MRNFDVAVIRIGIDVMAVTFSIENTVKAVNTIKENIEVDATFNWEINVMDVDVQRGIIEEGVDVQKEIGRVDGDV